MSFDPQVLKETEDFINIQETIYNVNDKNMEESLTICMNFINQSSNDKENLIDTFIHAVLNSIHYRPYNHDNVAKLCSKIMSKLEKPKDFNYFKEKILSIPIDRFQNYEGIPFLQKCYYQKMFENDEIISAILRYKLLTSHNINTILSFFCYFAPVIQESFPQLYEECVEKLNSKDEKSELPIEFRRLHKKFKFFKKMDWELQHVCSYNCYLPGTIELAIANDDQKEMQNIIEREQYEAYKYLVTPDDYLLDYEQFHPNKRVVPSVFEPAKLLLNNPTLIQFAAFHGSVNCFKYLIELGANPLCVDQVGIGLAQYAVCGNNMEIIHLCQKLNVDFARACHFAAAYDHLEIIEYMIKNMNLRILNCDDVFGTLLHRAAASNNIRILKYCIDHCTENAKNGVRNSCFDLNKIDMKCNKENIDEKEDSESDSSSSIESNPEFQIINVVTSHGETPLHAAAAKGSIEAVKLLLSHKMILPNAIGEDGCTPFYFSVLYNKIEVVKLLINDHRININKPDDEGQTPLHIAVKLGYFEIISELLASSRIQVNVHDINFQTPLHFAAIYDKLTELKLLLNDKRVEKNCQDNLGQTPLFVAVMQNNQEIVEELLKRNDVSITVPDVLGFSPLHIAVELHRLECERLIIHKNFGNDDLIENPDFNNFNNDALKSQKMLRKELNCVDNNGMNAIQLAAQNGDMESILLLQDSVNLFNRDNEGNNVLHIAAKNGKTEILSYLCEIGCFDFTQPNNLGFSPFLCSIQSSNFDTFLFFIRNQKELKCSECIHSFNNEKMSALSLAVRYENKDVLHYILETIGGFDINEQNTSKQTPLHIAASLHNHEIFERLLKVDGININLTDIHMMTPLLISILDGDEDDAMLLLDKKECQTNIQNEEGWSALHMAASVGNVKLLKKIISKKDVDVNALDNNGESALEIAIKYKNKEAEEYLVLKTSDKNLIMKDKSGKTAYDYAISTNQKEVAELIDNKINSPISSFIKSIPILLKP